MKAKLLFIFTLIIASIGNVDAQLWQRVHSPVDDTKALTITNNGDIFAGISAYGVYKSSDNGATWNNVSVNLADSNVRCLSASAAGVVFAGTLSQGVFTFNGASWNAANNGLPANSAIKYLEASPNGKMYCCDYSNKVYEYNAGTWSDITSNLFSTGPIKINSAGQVFIAVFGAGVYKYNGATWSLFGNNLPNVNVSAIAISATDSIFVLAGTGLAKISAAGGSWTALGFTVPAGKTGVGLFADAQDRVYVSTVNFSGGSGDYYGNLYVSHDNGNSFPLMVGDGLSNWFYAFATNSAGNIFISSCGVFRSTDGGITWNDVNQTIYAPRNGAAFCYAPDGDMYFVGVANGVFKSTDGGATWQLKNHGFTKIRGRSVFVASSGTVFAGMNTGINAGGSLYRSVDGGDNWTEVETGNDTYSRTKQNINGDLYSVQGFNHPTTLARSTDDGVTWTTLPVPEGMGFDIAFNSQGTIFLGTETGELQRSMDNGATWVHISNGFANANKNVIGVGVDIHDNVFVGESDFGHEAYFSDSVNNGNNVVSFSGFPSNGTVSAEYFWFAANDSAYIGTAKGFYAAAPPWSAATVWNHYDSGINVPGNIACLDVYPGNDGHLYLGLGNGGIYRSTAQLAPPVIVTGVQQTAQPSVSVFPNPSNGIFTFQCTVKISTLEVFDITGAKIYSGAVGNAQTQVDLSDAASGIYFYKIISQNQPAVTGKLIVR